MSFGASPTMSNYPYGFSFGVSLRNMPIAQTQGGQVFWVYNGSALPPTGKPGSNTNRGTFDAPFATIAGALTACLAGRGDIIMVKPGHAESVTAATLLNLNVAGAQIIGAGVGSNRPVLTLSGATTATITVSGANITLRNFIIDLTGIDAIAAGMTVNASGFQLLDCEIFTASASAQATLGVSIATGLSDIVIAGNEFYGTADAGTTAAVQIVGGVRHLIADNIFFGAYAAGTGAISVITTASAGLKIVGNSISNRTAASTKAITALTGTTGVILNNRMQILSGTAPITADAMSWAGANYYAAAIATAGTLI